jgi:hypothetical protein
MAHKSSVLTVSHLTPSGLARLSQKPQVPPVAIHIQPLRGYLAPLVTAFGASGAHLPQVSPVAIHIQPLSGLARWGHIYHRFHLWLLSRVANYYVSHSTPIGVISLRSLLRLARRGHIYHRFHLWLFTFNPFGVGVLISYQQNPL